MAREEILNEMLTEVSKEYDKRPGSFIYDALAPAARRFEKTDEAIEEAKKKMSIENLSGDELAERVKDRTGIDRKPATRATNQVLITGSPGALINQGDKVTSDIVSFSFAESLVVGSSGQTLVRVECDEYGTIGNVPANAIRFFPVTLPGLTSVTNPNPFSNGYNAESDTDLLQRYYERLRTPATSGNRAHYRNWAKEVIGVGAVKVIPLWAGSNTVKVVIIDANKQPASQGLIDEVQHYIDPGITGLGDGAAPIGAFCTVVSATELPITISLTVTKDPAYTDQQRQANVEAVVSEYLQSIAFVDSQVSYARIGSLILSTEGILDYTDLLINGGTSNIQIGNEEVPTLGGVTIV